MGFRTLRGNSRPLQGWKARSLPGLRMLRYGDPAAWLERECCWTKSLKWHLDDWSSMLWQSSMIAVGCCRYRSNHIQRRDIIYKLNSGSSNPWIDPKFNHLFFFWAVGLPGPPPWKIQAELVLKASGTALSSMHRTPHRWAGHASHGRSLEGKNQGVVGGLLCSRIH